MAMCSRALDGTTLKLDINVLGNASCTVGRLNRTGAGVRGGVVATYRHRRPWLPRGLRVDEKLSTPVGEDYFLPLSDPAQRLRARNRVEETGKDHQRAYLTWIPAISNEMSPSLAWAASPS